MHRRPAPRVRFRPDSETIARAIGSDEYRILIAQGGQGRFLRAGEVAQLRPPSPLRPLRALAELVVVAMAFGVLLVMLGVFA